MTPERVSQWNAYYDVYVKWAALILVFMVACNYVTDSHVWLHLKTGQLIAKQWAPVTTDVFSYTEAGQPWFNVPWLFQWVHALLYDFSYGLVPVDTIDPTANRARAEQIAVGDAGCLRRADPVLDGVGDSQVPASRAGSLVVGGVHDAGAGRDLLPDRGYLDGGIAGPSFVMPRDVGLVLPGPRAVGPFPGVFPGKRSSACGCCFRSSCCGQTWTSRSCWGWWFLRPRLWAICWIAVVWTFFSNDRMTKAKSTAKAGLQPSRSGPSCRWRSRPCARSCAWPIRRPGTLLTWRRAPSSACSRTRFSTFPLFKNSPAWATTGICCLHITSLSFARAWARFC